MVKRDQELFFQGRGMGSFSLSLSTWPLDDEELEDEQDEREKRSKAGAAYMDGKKGSSKVRVLTAAAALFSPQGTTAAGLP